MDITPEEALKQYEELKIQEKEISKQIEKLKPIVIEVVPEGEKLNTERGYFEKKSRVSWAFSAETEMKIKEIEEAKGEEKAKGIANPSYSYYVEYRQNKKKDVE